VRRVRPEFRTDLLTYIIHDNSWPFDDTASDLPPPPGLRSGRSGWLNFKLTAEEAAAKRGALAQYESQMKVMAWFLIGFARANEVFSRPGPPHVVLPIARDPCAIFAERVAPPRK